MTKEHQDYLEWLVAQSKLASDLAIDAYTDDNAEESDIHESAKVAFDLAADEFRKRFGKESEG